MFPNRSRLISLECLILLILSNSLFVINFSTICSLSSVNSLEFSIYFRYGQHFDTGSVCFVMPHLVTIASQLLQFRVCRNQVFFQFFSLSSFIVYSFFFILRCSALLNFDLKRCHISLCVVRGTLCCYSVILGHVEHWMWIDEDFVVNLLPDVTFTLLRQSEVLSLFISSYFFMGVSGLLHGDYFISSISSLLLDAVPMIVRDSQRYALTFINV